MHLFSLVRREFTVAFYWLAFLNGLELLQVQSMATQAKYQKMNL